MKVEKVVCGGVLALASNPPNHQDKDSLLLAAMTEISICRPMTDNALHRFTYKPGEL